MNNVRPIKRLYRSRKERIIAGICGGLGKYFRWDPVIIRIIWACITIFLAIIGGILIYLICWFAIPEEPEEPSDSL